MRVIDLKKVDKDSVDLYLRFIKQVEGLLIAYKEKDTENYRKIADKLAETDGEWDLTMVISNLNGDKKELEISQLFAYEYCKGIERATQGKVSFDYAMNRLFSEVNKFRIGNPKEGEDDVCLYGKKLDDETAIPVTTKMYRMVMNAGAQHLDYVRNGKIEGAVFIYEKQTIPDVGADVRKGKGPDATKELYIPGLNSDDLNDKKANGGVQLLTNLRQLVFHEWTHSMEKDEVETENQLTSEPGKFDYEFNAPDGRKYINFRKVKKFCQFKEGGKTAEEQEPTYVYDDYVGKNGEMKSGWFYIDKTNGKKYVVGGKTFRFDLKTDGELDNEIAISSGLSTVEIDANGEEIMHNIITEGWVESTSRAIIEANNQIIIESIANNEIKKELYVSDDIDKSKYRILVEMADRIIEGRDSYIGSIGQTRADFFSHSSLLKRELEGISIQLPNGEIDGLHYCADYAEADQVRRDDDRFETMATPIKKFLSKMGPVAVNLGLSKEVIDILQTPNGLFEQNELSANQVNELTALLNSGTIVASTDTIAIAQQVGLAPEKIAKMVKEVNLGNLVELRKKFVDGLVIKYTSLLLEQQEFLDSIPEKLGYQRQKDTRTEQNGGSISIKKTTENAITQGIATEDVSKVDSFERANDKNISEVSKDDQYI